MVDPDMTTRERGMSTDNLLASTSASLSETQNVQYSTDLLHSHSINTISSMPVVSEDLIAGQRLNGTMSNVRRFFCLFVTFDLLFTFLMWLICVMLNGENITDALRIQILHYDVHSSLFDIVMVSVCRFTILLLFYALLYINHWIIISLSTSATCIFLICKVFVFNWTDSHQPVFQVLLVLASFIIAWSEAWFLDFRVIPQETNASRYLVTSESERTPLIRSYVQNLPSHYTESVRTFYSPLASPDGSLLGVDLRRDTYINMSAQEVLEFKRKGQHALEEAWRIINSKDWKMEKQSDDGTTVHSMKVPKYGRAFMLTAVVNISPKYLLDELVYNVESIPTWNSSLIESKKLFTIDEYTDITYQVAPTGGKGLISSRDFVNLRHWGIVDGCYISAIESIEHANIPKNDKYVRGENGIGCALMRPINNEPTKCVFQWLLNTDLKISVPNYLLNNILIEVMFNYLRDLQAHIPQIQS